MSSANVHTDNTNCTVFVGICCSQNRFRISQLAKLPHFSARFDCQNKSSIVLSSKDSQTADHSFVAVGCVTHRQHDLLRLFPKLVNLCCCSHRPPKKTPPGLSDTHTHTIIITLILTNITQTALPAVWAETLEGVDAVDASASVLTGR